MFDQLSGLATGWGGFASLAIVAAFWRQFLAFAQRIRSLVIIKVTVQGDAASALSSYCLRNFRRSPIGDRLFLSGSAFVRPMNRVQEVAWERPPAQPIVFFDGWKPIMLGGCLYRKDDNMPDGSMASLSVFRWFSDPEAIVIAAIDEHNRLRGHAALGGARFYVRRMSGRGRRIQGGAESQASPERPAGATKDRHERFLKWKSEEIGPRKSANPMDAIVLPPEVSPAVNEFMRWRDSEEWFRSHQVPWRRGWLLHGVPGTGKTSLVRALAQTADMPIAIFDLSSLSNEEMTDKWQETQEMAPCIALFEDVDAVFDGRENVVGEQGGGLTFDCLLNCLSGVETADGVFVIVTTNCIEKLDDALKRPGRLDRIIEMPPLRAEHLRKIANRILGQWPDEVERVMVGADNLTGAQMTERCVERALELYWREPRA